MKKKKYIDAKKLKVEIRRRWRKYKKKYDKTCSMYYDGALDALDLFEQFIDSLQQEQPANMIQWTGSNLREVIDFTGKSPKFGEWFKSWDEFESYVHSHGDILKLFSEDGSHFEVPVGAWIVKTPDGYNVPSVARFIHAKQEQPEVDLEKEIEEWWQNWVSPPRNEYAVFNKEEFINIVRHFYELGLNAKKEEES